MIKNNRVDHVDIAKGISIILVALFHSNLRSIAPDLINPMGLFRMPLFFFLSGLFLSTSSSFNTFLIKKSDALLKPYYFTSFVLLVISAIANWGPYKGHLMYQFKGILYGNGATVVWGPLWFLTHLFAVYCFAYLVFRFTGIQSRRPVVKGIFVATMLAIGTHWIGFFQNEEVIFYGKNIELHGLPFSVDLVFISSAFFMAGSFLKERIVDFVPNLYVFFISIFIFVAIVVLTGAQIDLNHRVYANPLFATIGAVCGIYFSISISVYMSKIMLLRHALLVFGRASLFILIFHMYVGGMVYMVLVEAGNEGPVNIMVSLIAFLSSITLPLLIKKMVSRSEVLSLLYFPLKANNFLYRIRRAHYINEHLLKR